MVEYDTTDPFDRLAFSRRGPQSQREIDGLNEMIAKKERQQGVLEGFHGTSASRARSIQETGPENYRCVEGEFGVWFHDDEKKGNAQLHGIDKAREDGDSQYAIIRARSAEARPDLRGRPQWIAAADKLEILSVEFFDLPAT